MVKELDCGSGGSSDGGHVASGGMKVIGLALIPVIASPLSPLGVLREEQHNSVKYSTSLLPP